MYDRLLLNIHIRTTPNPEEALHDVACQGDGTTGLP
jgi:hypothetical protein